MKYLLPLFFSFVTPSLSAQAPADSSGVVSPNPEQNIETSYESGEILLMAVAGLAILVAAYFLYRRRNR